MKKNYYYLIAGLPELSLDDSKLGITVREFRELYYPDLSDDDRALLDLIYLSYDNANLLALLYPSWRKQYFRNCFYGYLRNERNSSRA